MNYFITTKTLQYALDDSLNYNYILQNTAVECFKTYVEIINDYIIQYKSIHTPNKTLYTYLLDKGICTINHIFKLMLLYTKNLELTNHYCRQTIRYYVEFIVQNMQHDENDIINYNNASRFSYSKTIDKLVKHYRKTSYNELDDNSSELLSMVEAKEADLYSIVNMLMEVYSKMIVIGASEAGASTSEAGSDAAQYIFNLLKNETYLREKLVALLAFINNFPLKTDIALKYVYCLCEHLQYDLPSKLNIIKKLSSTEHKIRLQKDLVDTYICWIMV
jgi:hypothetical protein